MAVLIQISAQPQYSTRCAAGRCLLSNRVEGLRRFGPFKIRRSFLWLRNHSPP